MSSQLAVVALLVAGFWLAAIGLVMAISPVKAIGLLRRTAETQKANLVEQVPRLIVGVALIVRAPLSKWPAAFEIGGWFVALSSLVLLVVPLRWHSGYANWWADRFPDWAVRAVAPLSIAGAVSLVYATF